MRDAEAQYEALRETLLDSRKEHVNPTAAVAELSAQLEKSPNRNADVLKKMKLLESLAAGHTQVNNGNFGAAALHFQAAVLRGESSARILAAEAFLHDAHAKFAASMREQARDSGEHKRRGSRDAGEKAASLVAEIVEAGGDGESEKLTEIRDSIESLLRQVMAQIEISERREQAQSGTIADRRGVQAPKILVCGLQTGSERSRERSEESEVRTSSKESALSESEEDLEPRVPRKLRRVKSQKYEPEPKWNEKKERFVNTFRRLDTEKTGTILCHELEQVLVQVGLSKPEVADMFTCMDLNQDGEVDYNEFACWLFAAKPVDVKCPFINHTKLSVEDRADVLLFLLEDARVQADNGKEYEYIAPKPGSLERASTRELIEISLSSVAPGGECMHPQRAQAGALMIQHVPEWLQVEPDPQSSVDKEIVKLVFLDSLPKDEIEIDSVEQVAQPAQIKGFLKKVAEAWSCIEAVFHGTAERNVQPIIDHGLNTESTGTRRGRYGIGAYVAAHAGFAHKYTQTNSNGQRRMFCVLMDSGKTVQGANSVRHSNTAVDKLWNPEQYCFCDHDRLLVTHLITYRVTGPGLFAPALRLAIKRAGEREQSTSVKRPLSRKNREAYTQK